MSPGSKSNSFQHEQVRLADRKQDLWVRARMVQAIRRFFVEHGYLEIETPLLIPSPAPEIHIDAVSAGDLYLHTSPELCMKRLLAAGYPNIFQICKCFRANERGDLHLPEFTLLECYRTGADYHALMEECEALIPFVCQHMGLGKKINYQGMEIDLSPPWEKIAVSQAFERHSPLSLETALEKGCFDEVMAREIEPRLGIPTPSFLYDYPAPLAALARLRKDDQGLSERFEIYIAGMELANGFSELTDSYEQRARFQRVLEQRRNLGKKVYPMPENFLRALDNMPETAGIALGVDRLAMIFTNRPRIDPVVSFTPEEV